MRLDKLHPKVKALAEKLIQMAEEHGITIIVTQGYRSIEEQDALYAKGRTKPGPKVTNARGGQSFHNFGVAFDIAVVGKNKKITWDTKADVNDNEIPDYVEVGTLGELIGLEWGGRWRFVDLPHFQFTDGLSLRDFQDGKTLD